MQQQSLAARVCVRFFERAPINRIHKFVALDLRCISFLFLSFVRARKRERGGEVSSQARAARLVISRCARINFSSSRCSLHFSPRARVGESFIFSSRTGLCIYCRVKERDRERAAAALLYFSVLLSALLDFLWRKEGGNRFSLRFDSILASRD